MLMSPTRSHPLGTQTPHPPTRGQTRTMETRLSAGTDRRATIGAEEVKIRLRRRLTPWLDIPAEIKIKIFAYLEPREIIRSSRVSRCWHQMCYDSQLWSILDTAGFYRTIPAAALVTIVTAAGPFLRNLDLYGVQLHGHWNHIILAEACGNLQNLSLKGCGINPDTLHSFLNVTNRLVHIDLSGLEAATNRAMSIIAANCHKLEHLGVSWCDNINTCGLQRVIEACPALKDIRAGNVSGWENVEVMQQLFLRNSLECLVLTNCDSLTNESMAVLIEGKESGVNHSTRRPTVPPRRLKRLDLTRCRGISGPGVCKLVNNVPEMEDLRLSKCHGIFDETFTQLLPTTPVLAHLDVEELEELTDTSLLSLASSRCATHLQHLNVTDCKNMGDVGMVTLLQSCKGLQSLEMNNTNVSDLVLLEAAAMVRQRNPRTVLADDLPPQPTVGLFLSAYDCPKVTWTGIREILSHNTEVITTTATTLFPQPERYCTGSPREVSDTSSSPSTSLTQLLSSTTATPHPLNSLQRAYPFQLIRIFIDFYTCQRAVDVHIKRVLQCDLPAAQRLERKWIEFVMAQEEMEAGGGGRRFKKSKARKARMRLADEMSLSVRTKTSIWRRLKVRVIMVVF
jgi:F-box/leucine-rich repeat protein 2/20